MVKNSCLERPYECVGTVGTEISRCSMSNHRGQNTGVEILTAVVAALGKVKKLIKSDRNEPEGYTFSSIDSFLALVNPICAETGLVVLMDETHVEDVSTGALSDNKAWLRISYEITLAHVSGQMLGPFRRHVDIPRTGPQAYGAAQSYVLKQFLRAQFQIATGESDDPDFGSGATDANASGQQPATRKPISKKVQDQVVPLDQVVVVQLASRIIGARSGRELLAILGGLSDECLVEEELIMARLTALLRIVGSAPSLAALDKLEHHFPTDWPKVCWEAERRRTELLFAVNQTERTTSFDVVTAPKSPPDRPPEHAVCPGSDHPTLLPSNAPVSDDSDFGDIPYSEAAA